MCVRISRLPGTGKQRASLRAGASSHTRPAHTHVDEVVQHERGVEARVARHHVGLALDHLRVGVHHARKTTVCWGVWACICVCVCMLARAAACTICQYNLAASRSYPKPCCTAVRPCYCAGSVKHNRCDTSNSSVCAPVDADALHRVLLVGFRRALLPRDVRIHAVRQPACAV